MSAQPSRIFEFGSFRLDLPERLLLNNGKQVPLTSKAFEVLRLLIERRGHLVGKDVLMNEVWADSFVEEANISRTIWMLRQVLEEDKNGQDYIQTVPKHGYRFIADVVEISVPALGGDDGSSFVEEQEAETQSVIGNPDKRFHLTPHPESVVAESGRSTMSGSKRLIFGVATVAVLAIGLAGASYKYLLGKNRAITPTAVESLAVLPMENLSGNPEHEYLADGFTEGLIGTLSSARSLRVTAPKSALAYRRTERSYSEIASALNVQTLVAGSFYREGVSVRVTSRLIDPVSGETLWSGNYERSPNDLWSLQEEIARDLALALHTELRPEANNLLAIDPEAYDLYMRGRYRLRDEGYQNSLEAIEFFEQATKRDSNFALAFAQLALAYNLHAFHYTAPNTQFEEKAFAAAERAILLQPNLAEAHLARGYVLWSRKNGFPHEQVIQEYKRALELKPSLDDARYQLGRVYMHLGLFDKATAEFQLAAAINPTSLQPKHRIAVLENYRHRYESSLSLEQELPADFEGVVRNYQKAWSLCHLNRLGEAKSLVDIWRKSDARDDEGGLLVSIQALLAAHAGDAASVEKYAHLAEVDGSSENGHFHHSAYTLAAAYAVINRPRQALKWLKLAVDSGFPCYPLIANEPDFENLRQDAAFNDLMARQKELWETRLRTL